MIKWKHWKGWIILSKREKAESYEKKDKERPNGLLKYIYEKVKYV